VTRRRSTSPENLWLSVQSAADQLGLTTRTIYRFINEGKLAAYRFGRVYRIRREDLDSFVASSAVRPGDLDHLIRTSPIESL